MTEYLLASYIKKEKKKRKVLMGSLLPLIDTKIMEVLGTYSFVMHRNTCQILAAVL